MFSSRKFLLVFITVVTLSAMAIGCRDRDGDLLDRERQQEPDQLYEGLQTLDWDGLVREFRVHTPTSYSADQEWPLVVVLHAGGSNAVSIRNISGFSPLADQEGFVVVYPNGTSNVGNSYGWNSGHCCASALDNNIDDVGFLETMLNDVQTHLSIDPNRIYFTGHSNGGMMCHRFAAERSDIVAAVAPVSGSIGGKNTPNSDLCVPQEPTNPVSVMIIHGIDDPNVLYEGGHGPNTNGLRIDLSVAESAAFWIDANGCDPNNPSLETIVDGVTRETYSGGLEGTVVEIVSIEGGEHPWAGSNADVAQLIDAAPLIWEFFENH